MWTKEELPRNTAPTGLEVYTKEWIAYHAHAASVRAYSRYLVSLINRLPKVMSVADIGCASGALVHMLSKEGYSALGQDVVEVAIEYAKRHHKGLFVSCELDTLISYGTRYDVVVLAHILEHLDDPKKLLQQARFLTRRYLLVSVPNLASCSDTGWRTTRKNAVLTHNHRVAYTPDTISEAVSSNGYHVLEVSTRTYPGTILTGWIVYLGRMILTMKSPTETDKSLISPKVGVQLDELWARMPRTPFDALSERNNRGDCIIVLAEKR